MQPSVLRRRRRLRPFVMTNPLAQIPDLYAGFSADDPLWTPPSVAYTDPTNGLVLPATAGNYASVPNEAAINALVDYEHVERVTFSDYTPAAVCYSAGRLVGVGTRQIGNSLNTLGQVGITWSPDGTATSSLAVTTTLPSVGIVDGQTIWIRRRLDVDDGAGGHLLTVHYSTENVSSPDAVTWTLLGTRSGVGVTSIYTGSTSLWYMGAFNAATTHGAPFSVLYSDLRSGIGGASIVAVDFRRARAETFTASTGQTVTVNSGAAVASGLPLRGTLAGNSLAQATSSKQGIYRGALALLNHVPVIDLDGVDDLFELLVGVNLPQPWSLLWVGTHDSLGVDAMVGTNSGSNNNRFGLTTGPVWAARFGAAASITGGTPVANTPYAALAYANGTSSVVQVNGTTVASGSASTDALDQIVLGAGLTAAGSVYSNFHDGKTYSFYFVPGDLRTKWYYPALRAHLTRKTGIVFA